MSPEIIRGDENVKGESDYWALGVILYLAYTKRCPFDGDNAFAIFDNVLEYKIDWNLLEAKKINPNLLEFIKGLLAFDIQDRICSIKKVKMSPLFQGNNLSYSIYINL